MFDEIKISFRKLQTDDITLLHKWCNEPFVKKWYSKGELATLNDISKKYIPRIKGEEPIECFIINYENTPVAFIQTYKVDSNVAGIDLFIGNQDFYRKGFGTLMIKKFLRDIVFIRDNIRSCLVDPEPNNIRAIKSYEKVGFRYLKTIQIPSDPLPKYLMIVRKEFIPK